MHSLACMHSTANSFEQQSMTSRVFTYRVFYTGFTLLPTTVEIGRLVFVATATDFILEDALFFGPNINDFFDVHLSLVAPRNFKIDAGAGVAQFTLSLDNDFTTTTGLQYTLNAPQSLGAPVSLNGFDLGTNSIDILTVGNVPPTPAGIVSSLSIVNPKYLDSGFQVNSFVASVVLLVLLIAFLLMVNRRR